MSKVNKTLVVDESFEHACPIEDLENESGKIARRWKWEKDNNPT